MFAVLVFISYKLLEPSLCTKLNLNDPRPYLFLKKVTNNVNDVCVCVCVCVCVFFPFILDIKFVGRTSRGHTGGRSHSISHPPSFCGACLNFSREKNSAIPFPSSTVKSNFVYQRFNRSPPVGHLFLFFFVRKIPFAGIELTYVCVFLKEKSYPFILDIKFVGRTSRGQTGGRSHRISHPPSSCGACLNFSREKDSAIPFPRRP